MELFFHYFLKQVFFSQSSQYILVNEKWETGKKKQKKNGGQETLLLKDGAFDGVGGGGDFRCRP